MNPAHKDPLRHANERTVRLLYLLSGLVRINAHVAGSGSRFT